MRDFHHGTRRAGPRPSVKHAGRRLAAGGVGHRRSVVAVDDVRVPAGRPYVAEHEEHQGDHHRQQEPLGVQAAAGVTSAVVVAAVAPHAAARSRSHGLT